MIRSIAVASVLAIIAPGMGLANGASLPPLPAWQTDAATCSWQWREGGGIGLWAETCDLGGATWQVVWDDAQGAFVTRRDDVDMGIAVQGFALPPGTGIDALGETLIDAGALEAGAPCTWQAFAPRPAPRTMAFHVLAPSDPSALGPTAQGEVPDPLCGPYGASTHGVRYFITDLRWPERAIFVEEGQERPLFDPMSIMPLP
jgi:hypothetical protein